jgi:protein O-mannosyl-transferase
MSPEAKRQKLLDRGIWLGLILSVFVVYARVAGFDFIIYDDGPHVYRNPYVQAGLTLASVKWALGATVLGNWMPVTLLSHIADSQLFGMEPGWHHLSNAVFHAVAAVLLYAAFLRATSSRGASAFVAFVFALHPLHVGSVAWVSERKDILGALFWFLALYLYVRYTENPGVGRYLWVTFAVCLGLMSKPMVITLPFTLLLFDIWPLRRTQWPKTILEKIPFFVLSAVVAAVTYSVQDATGALASIPMRTRIANAFISYVTYLRQMFWPSGLSIFYPYPHVIPAWKAGVAAVAVLGISALAILAWRSRPYLTVGWFWYVGTLVPVIGVVQAGMQSHADRYMYVPMVGLLVMLAWGGQEAAGRWPPIKPAVSALAAAYCIACLALAWRETGYWRNNETIFERAIAVTQDNWVAENDLGTHLYRLGRSADAIRHFQEALRVEPNYAPAHNNLGTALFTLGGCPAAIPQFEVALQIDPGFADANDDLGKCKIVNGDYAAAIPYFEAVLRKEPGRVDAHFNLALAFSKLPGRASDAIRQYEAVLSAVPDDRSAHAGLGQLLASLGRTQEAIAHLEAAQFARPDPDISKLLDRLRAEQPK